MCTGPTTSFVLNRVWTRDQVVILLLRVNIISVKLVVDTTEHIFHPCYTQLAFLVFLPERDYVTFGSLLSLFRLSSVCLSVCRLSVTLVHPTQGVEPFGKISSPLCTLVILWPPCKILRISSQGNPSVGGVKRKRGIKIERFRTYQRLSHKRYKIDV